MFVGATEATPLWRQWGAGSDPRPTVLAHGTRLDDDDRLRGGMLIREGKVDHGLVPWWRQRSEAAPRLPGEVERRLAGGEVDHSHLLPAYAPDAGSERLGAGLLGSEALRIGAGAIGAPIRLRPLRRCKAA